MRILLFRTDSSAEILGSFSTRKYTEVFAFLGIAERSKTLQRVRLEAVDLNRRFRHFMRFYLVLRRCVAGASSRAQYRVVHLDVVCLSYRQIITYDTRPPDTVGFNKRYLSVTCEQRLKKGPMGKKKVSLCSHGEIGQLFCCEYRSKNATVSRPPKDEGNVMLASLK